MQGDAWECNGIRFDRKVGFGRVLDIYQIYDYLLKSLITMILILDSNISHTLVNEDFQNLTEFTT